MICRLIAFRDADHIGYDVHCFLIARVVTTPGARAMSRSMLALRGKMHNEPTHARYEGF